MVEQISILCRGSSMIQAGKYFHDVEGDMIAVNEFNEELKNDFVHRLFENKNVIHMVSKDAGLSNLRPEYYKKYNIDNVVLNRFQDEFNECAHMRGLLESFGLRPSYLPDTMKPFQKDGGGFPTTGSIAILYATLVLNKKDIHIAGMDFYEKDYFNKIPVKDYQKEKGKFLKQFIIEFIKKYKDVNYTFYTDSDFNPNLKNVKVIGEK